MKIKKLVSFALLTVMLVGISVIPGNADTDSPPEIKLTVEQAVDMAIKNNPQVGMAKADKKKKDIAYREAKRAGEKIDGSRNEGTYQGNLVEYLNPKIAKRQGEQADKVYEITVNGIKVQVEKAFYDLIQAREMQEIAENALKRVDEQVRIANLRFDIGSAAKVEVLTAEAGQAATRAALTAARNEYKQKMLELNKTLGINLDTCIKPQGVFEFTKEEFKFQDLLDAALVEDMSIIKAQDAYEIATWSYEFVKSYYGANNWDARKGEQDMIMAELNLQKTRDELVTSVHQSYYNYLALEEQYEYLQKTVELKKEAYRLTELSYEVGMATLTEVQEASDAVKEAEANLSNCVYQYNTLKSSLKYSLF